MSDEKTPVRLWDAINGCREEATDIDPFLGVEIALIDYAEKDHDGLCDGLYIKERTNTPKPHPFIVEYSDGSRETWEVYGELSVDFYADRKVTEGEASDD